MQSSRRERQSGEPSEIKKEEGHSVTDLTKGRENRTEMSRKTRTLPGRLSGEGFRSISNKDGKEIRPVHPKGDQSHVFIGRADVEAETPILWPPHVKSRLIGKDPDAGKD